MRTFLRDLRYAVRSLRGSPWLALTAVVAMALGIGLTTTIYSVIDVAMLRGLPFPNGDRIVVMTRTFPAREARHDETSARDLMALRERQHALEGLAGYTDQPVNLSGDDRAERVTGSRMTANAFALLRMHPALGRAFTAQDDAPGAPLTAVISDGLWHSRFQGDPRVLGRVIRVDGEAATIVGVMPPGFGFPVSSSVWMPTRLDPANYLATGGESLSIFGRLRPGRSPDVASRELTSLLTALVADRPANERGVRVELTPYVTAFMGGENAMQLWTMLAAVVLVLVVACVNVANLLLARAALRTREIGVRSALGAQRGRLVALFLAESLTLALAGALGGVAIAWVGMRVFSDAVADTQPPFWLVLHLDGRVLLFVGASTAIAAIVAGCLPAMHAAQSGPGEVLKDGARGASGVRVGRVSRGLVIVELALSGGLLVGTGMMVTTIDRLRTRDFGVDTHGTFVGRMMLPARLGEGAANARFMDQLLRRLRDAGVSQPALASALPVADGSPAQPFHMDGAATVRGDGPNGELLALRVAVSPGYFAAVGAHAPQGRDFDARDANGSTEVAMVNAAFVRRYLAGQDPIGRRVVTAGDGKATRTLTVVGIAPDVSPGGTSPRRFQEAVYVPLAQWPARYVAIAARSPRDPLALARPVRAAVAALDPDLAVSSIGTLEAEIARRTWFYRVFGGAFTVFGTTALFLAALGLYAVMAASVARRTRELGIRRALGAETRGILGLVLRQGVTQIVIGGALGLVLGFGLSQLLRGLLFGVRPGDPVVMLGVVGILGLTGVAASLVPALRASRVDPMMALRAD